MNQQNNQTEMQQSYNYDDEIDIGQLFTKIWQRKLFISSFVIVVVVIMLGVFSAKYFKSPPVKEYSRILQFTFTSSSKGLYPSGRKFSANDILSSNILNKTYVRNKLKEEGVDLETFISSFSVSPYASNVAYIDKKFSGLLGNKKLSRPEIIELEREYLKQLSAAQSRFVKISYIEQGLVGLDRVLIDKILKDIPKIWSQTAIKELGVINLKVFGSDFYQKELVDEYEYIKALSYLSNSSKKLGDGLNILSKDAVGGSLINLETNRTVYDLLAKLDRLQTFEIKPLFANFVNLGISKSLFEAKLYIENKIQELEDKRLILKNKESNYKKVLESYVAQFSDQSKRLASKGQSGNTGLSQFDAGFFKQLSELIEGKSDAKYKQSLLKSRLDTMQIVEELDGELVKFKRALKVLLKKKKKYSKEIIDGAVNHIDLINIELSVLVDEYQQLLDLRNSQLLGDSGSLYSLVSSEMMVETGLKGFIKKMILFSALATFLSLMIAVMIALIRKSPSDNAKST